MVRSMAQNFVNGNHSVPLSKISELGWAMVVVTLFRSDWLNTDITSRGKDVVSDKVGNKI